MSDKSHYQQLAPHFPASLPLFASLRYRQLGYVHHDASGGSTARGEALAELNVLEHQLLTDPKVAQWIAAAGQKFERC